MKYIYEIELWSIPGDDLPRNFGEQVAHKLKADLSLSDNVVCGHYFHYEKEDVNNLELAIAEAELSNDEFRRYCQSFSLIPDTKNNESASKYLDYEYGRCLAWIHIPHDDSGIGLYKSIFNWAKINKFVLQNSDSIYCINKNISDGDPMGWYKN